MNAFYLNCDRLDKIPAINKQNWLFEFDLQRKLLPQNATVLQVGSMDATRIIEMLELRPDLRIIGLEIEKDFIALAKENLRRADFQAGMIEADITKFRSPTRYDYVTCLNNTLGYISGTEAAVAHMKETGNTVFVSVYGETFDSRSTRRSSRRRNSHIHSRNRNTRDMNKSSRSNTAADNSSTDRNTADNTYMSSSCRGTDIAGAADLAGAADSAASRSRRRPCPTCWDGICKR